MKFIYFPLLIVSFILFSNCNKEKFVPEDEVPKWLKEIIKAAEIEIAETDSKMMPHHGAWIRYKFENNYYFEYDNPLSSVMLEVYNFEGEHFNFYDDETLNSYQEDKCCKKFVWKAPNYNELSYNP